MKRRIRAAKLNASATRPSTRSHKVWRVRKRVLACLLAALAAVLGIYALTQSLRADSEGVEVVVGAQRMANIPVQDLAQAVSAAQALEAVSVRPTSMQRIQFMGRDLLLEVTQGELEDYYLISGEKAVLLTDAEGKILGEMQRIYLPIDE